MGGSVVVGTHVAKIRLGLMGGIKQWDREEG